MENLYHLWEVTYTCAYDYNSTSKFPIVVQGYARNWRQAHNIKYPEGVWVFKVKARRIQGKGTSKRGN